MYNNINNERNKIGFRKPFVDLVERKRNERIATLSNAILAACIDKPQYDKFGAEYLENNVELAADVKMMVDGVRHRCQ